MYFVFVNEKNFPDGIYSFKFNNQITRICEIYSKTIIKISE